MGRSGSGFESVSLLYAEKVWEDLCFHDDGIIGHGGTNCMVFGGQGSGKTTIATYIATKLHYIEGVKKSIFLAGRGGSAKPETILWAGNDQDYWNIFLPGKFEKAFPNLYRRPLRVFVHEKDKFTFFERGKTDKLNNISGDVQAFKYQTQDDLMSNLVHGGINVIYPPYTTYLSNHLKHLLNERMMVTSSDKKFMRDTDDVLVPPFIFWYELFENIYSVRGEMRGRQWYSFILDECHRIFPLNPRAPLWHLVDWFADVLVDTRRANLSLYGFTHSTNVIDFRILARFGHWIWLTGSRPSHDYSRVVPNLVSALALHNQRCQHLNERWAIAERARQYYGRFPFPDIANRPDLLIARRDIPKQQREIVPAEKTQPPMESEEPNFDIGVEQTT